MHRFMCVHIYYIDIYIHMFRDADSYVCIYILYIHYVYTHVNIYIYIYVYIYICVYIFASTYKTAAHCNTLQHTATHFLLITSSSQRFLSLFT